MEPIREEVNWYFGWLNAILKVGLRLHSEIQTAKRVLKPKMDKVPERWVKITL